MSDVIDGGTSDSGVPVGVGELLLPVPEPDNQGFWDALRVEELRIQRCAACGELRHPPQPMCPRCNDFEHEWALMSGRGSVYSYVVSHQAVHPSLQERTPFVTVLVELDERPRLLSNLVGMSPDEVEIGMAVEVVFHRLDAEIVLPLFRRAG
jgi:uncharacterized OB-fold protein